MMIPVEYKCFKSKRHFGVELELDPSGVTKNDIRHIIHKISPERDIRVTDWESTNNNAYWHVKQDSTCGPQGHIRKDYGWEVASYKASGFKDIKHIANVAESLRQENIKVNRNCGLHVHAEVADFSPAQVAVLVAWWIKIEQIMCCLVPMHRIDNKHCRRWTTYKKFNLDSYCGAGDFWEYIKPDNFDPNGNVQKKVTFNIMNFAAAVHHENQNGYSRRTVELRMPEGTLIGDEVAHWTKMFVHFVESNRQSHMPPDLHPVRDLQEFFRILGIGGGNSFYILSKGLCKTKMWILQRIIDSEYVRVARMGEVYEQARQMLSLMTAPVVSKKPDEDGYIPAVKKELDDVDLLMKKTEKERENDETEALLKKFLQDDDDNRSSYSDDYDS